MKTDAKEKGHAEKRRLRERRGRRAENAAALWLQLKGYHILDRRARTPACEIDLVAAKGKMLIFVEVKSRASFTTALEAVTPQFQKRLQDAANIWVSRHKKMHDWLWRFDLVLLTPGRLPRHMPDAWRAEKR
ncbi:MAG: YraN family protein [Hyphomonadaceae bacterium]|nr:YraN family protein [Hyphomonadaceae bacterium]